jgi:LPS export ABC transporter protein LptC
VPNLQQISRNHFTPLFLDVILNPYNMIKSNKIRQLLALFVVFASLALVIVITLKIHKGRLQKELPRILPKNIDVSLKQVHLTETREGEKKWDLFAEKAEYDKTNETTHLTGGVRFVVAGGGDTGDITVTASSADYHNNSKNVTMSGDVLAKSASGMEITAKGAEYIADRNVIVSSGRVRFTDGRLTLEGVGMELRLQSRDFRILSGVTADILPRAAK